MVMQRRPPSPNSMDVPNHTPPPKLQEHIPTEVRKGTWCHKARRLASVRRATHTNSKHRGRTPAKEQSEVPFSCKSYQFFTSACGNRFQSWIQVDLMLQYNAGGFGACRQTSQVTTAWAVKHGSRAWAAAASTRLCSRFRRRFFCRPPLSVPVASASEQKTSSPASWGHARGPDSEPEHANSPKPGAASPQSMPLHLELPLAPEKAMDLQSTPAAPELAPLLHTGVHTLSTKISGRPFPSMAGDPSAAIRRTAPSDASALTEDAQ